MIGLPGERVVIKDGVLSVYNSEHPEGFQPDKGAAWEAKMVKDLKSESLDLTLGQSELFVYGDNRPESIDSRFNGALDTREMVGKVVFQY